MKLATLTAIALLTGAAVHAAGSGDHSHDHNHGETKMMDVGVPGKAEEANRTVDVIMRETDDGGMIFDPAKLELQQGETIRFVVTNAGELEHEFVLDTKEGNVKHKEMMAQMDMDHDDPNSITLDSGESGEIVWKFANAGSFEFACLIPGHYESGMLGPIEVAQTETGRTFTKGVVKNIKADKGKVTIIHEELTDLDMPAMTMVFDAETAIIDKLSEGQEIEFSVERIKGKLTVTGLR